jgi:hypothetical protein
VPPFGVVTDNYHFALSPSGKIGDSAQRRLSPPEPQRTGRSLKAEMPKKVMRSYTGTKLAFGA